MRLGIIINTLLGILRAADQSGIFKKCERLIRKGQRRSQSPESAAPNVRVRNPIGQNQSPVNTSTGCRETRKRRQRVSNRESVTPRKPGGGSRNLEENRKWTTKSRSPWKENPGTPGKTESPQQRLSHPWKLSISTYLSIYPSIYLSI